MASQRSSIFQLAEVLRQSITEDRLKAVARSSYVSSHISMIQSGNVCVPPRSGVPTSHCFLGILSLYPRPPLRAIGVDLRSSSPRSFRESLNFRFQSFKRTIPARLLLLVLWVPLLLDRAISKTPLEIKTIERALTILVVLLSLFYLTVTLDQPVHMAHTPGQELYARADAFLSYAGLPGLEATLDTLDHLPQYTPLTDYTVSSGYGRRLHPITYRPSFHHGVDLAAEEGSPIFPPGMGRIAETGVDRGYGVFVVVDHSPAPYRTLFGHLRSHNVQVGDSVRPSLEIAQVGSTGQSTGPHLHYQIFDNSGPVDPHLILRRASSVRDSLRQRLHLFDFHLRSHVSRHSNGSHNATLYQKALKHRLSSLLERVSYHFPSSVTSADSIATDPV